MQSVKYPADGLCHSSIAQEEANARVLEKKPQEAACGKHAVTVDWNNQANKHNLNQVCMQLSKSHAFKMHQVNWLHGMLQENLSEANVADLCMSIVCKVLLGTNSYM